MANSAIHGTSQTHNHAKPRMAKAGNPRADQSASPSNTALEPMARRMEGGVHGLATRYAAAASSAARGSPDGQRRFSIARGTVTAASAASTNPNMLASIMAAIAAPVIA